MAEKFITNLTNIKMRIGCLHGSNGVLEGMEYKIFPEKKSRHDAEASCKSWGGGSMRTGLIDIVNEQIQACLLGMIATSSVEFEKEEFSYYRALHVGGSNIGGKGRWKWGNNNDIPLPKQVSSNLHF